MDTQALDDSELLRHARVDANAFGVFSRRHALGVSRCNGRHDGIPILRIEMSWGDNEKAMVPDMAESAAEMMDAAGAKNIRPYAIPDRIPGYGIHEVGVARMGKDPKTSVLNQFQQSHDVRNLFVVDGSSHVSASCQNPTWTIMALAWRSCEHLADELKRGNL